MRDGGTTTDRIEEARSAKDVESFLVLFGSVISNTIDF